MRVTGTACLRATAPVSAYDSVRGGHNETCEIARENGSARTCPSTLVQHRSIVNLARPRVRSPGSEAAAGGRRSRCVQRANGQPGQCPGIPEQGHGSGDAAQFAGCAGGPGRATQSAGGPSRPPRCPGSPGDASWPAGGPGHATRPAGWTGHATQSAGWTGHATRPARSPGHTTESTSGPGDASRPAGPPGHRPRGPGPADDTPERAHHASARARRWRPRHDATDYPAAGRRYQYRR
jgi:hypothetical protein